MCRPPAVTTLSWRICRPGRGELRLEIAAEHDVGAATGHVGGDGYSTWPARLRDDVRLALVLLGVQHLVLDALLLQET